MVGLVRTTRGSDLSMIASRWEITVAAVFLIGGLVSGCSDRPWSGPRQFRDVRVELRRLPSAGRVLYYGRTRDEILLHKIPGPRVSRLAWDRRTEAWRLLTAFDAGFVPGFGHPVVPLHQPRLLITLRDFRRPGSTYLAHTLNGELYAAMTAPSGLVSPRVGLSHPVLVGNRGVADPYAAWPTPLLFLDLEEQRSAEGPYGTSAVPLSRTLVLFAVYEDDDRSCTLRTWNTETGEQRVVARCRPAVGVLSPVRWNPGVVVGHLVQTRRQPDLSVVSIDLKTGKMQRIVSDAVMAQPHLQQPLLAYLRLSGGATEVAVRCMVCRREFLMPRSLSPARWESFGWSPDGACVWVQLSDDADPQLNSEQAERLRLAIIDCEPHLKRADHQAKAARNGTPRWDAVVALRP